MPRQTTLTNGSERLDYSTKETAQCIREALKAAFPGGKFSVTTSYASMTSATSIRWTDGPTEPEVEYVTNRFTSKTFDGSDDSTHYHAQDFHGQRVQFSGWVQTTRYVSVALLTKALARYQALRAEYGLPAADLAVTENGRHPYIGGRDVNAAAGVNPGGYRYAFRYCSDAVQSIAYHLRPNGIRVIMKDR